MSIILGTTLFFEVENVNDELFNNLDTFEKLLNDICKIIDATIVKKCNHIFDNKGTTIVYILAESSLILHSWPEYNSFTIDLFMCSDNIDDKKIVNSIKEIIKTDKIKYNIEYRKIEE